MSDIVITDNFLQMPNLVREWALKQEFKDDKGFIEKYKEYTNWPGLRSEHVVELDKEYADIVLNKVATIAQTSFGMKNISIKSYFQITRQQDGDSWVHIDNGFDVAGVLYLNPNAPVRSGTTLYRCLNRDKWSSYIGTEDIKHINEQDNIELYNELFEPVDMIGNVFNRLIMYRSEYFHKSNKYFGSNINDGRLTQVFFLKGE
jgi:hypothetical protein